MATANIKWQQVREGELIVFFFQEKCLKGKYGDKDNGLKELQSKGGVFVF